MPINRRRRLPPRPPPENGVWLRNPDNNTEVFILFDELKDACTQMMDPANAYFVEHDLGKPHYRNDPTYNMRKK